MSETPDEAARLRAIAEREQQATKGPWAWESVAEQSNEYAVGTAWDTATDQPISGLIVRTDDPETDNWLEDTVLVRDTMGLGEGNMADAAFIAHARDDVPYLLSLVARQAQEIQELRSRLASALAEREEALLSIGGVQSDLRKADQEIQDLRSQSVMALAKHYGCGEHVSFSDAWRWLAERVEMETFKSSAETALGAFVARIKALRAEIQDLRTDFESFSEHHAATERELKAALSSRDALREALKKARGYVVERMQLANPYDGPAKPGFVDYDLQMIDRALVETPTEKTL